MPQEVENKKKKRDFLGLGALLANKEALFALGSGLTAASRGGDFSQGLLGGLSAYGAMDLARAQRGEHEALSRRRDDYAQGLDPELRNMFEMAPDAFVDAQVKSQFATPKSTSKQQNFAFLRDQFIEGGMDSKAASNEALKRLFTDPASLGGEIRLPDGTVVRTGVGLKEMEAKYGVYAASVLDADAAI